MLNNEIRPGLALGLSVSLFLASCSSEDGSKSNTGKPSVELEHNQEEQEAILRGDAYLLENEGPHPFFLGETAINSPTFISREDFQNLLIADLESSIYSPPLIPRSSVASAIDRGLRSWTQLRDTPAFEDARNAVEVAETAKRVLCNFLALGEIETARNIAYVFKIEASEETAKAAQSAYDIFWDRRRFNLCEIIIREFCPEGVRSLTGREREQEQIHRALRKLDFDEFDEVYFFVESPFERELPLDDKFLETIIIAFKQAVEKNDLSALSTIESWGEKMLPDHDGAIFQLEGLNLDEVALDWMESLIGQGCGASANRVRKIVGISEDAFALPRLQQAAVSFADSYYLEGGVRNAPNRHELDTLHWIVERFGDPRD